MVRVTDMVTYTAPGEALGGLWERLMAGKTAIGPVRRFPTKTYKADVAACIPDLETDGEKSMMHGLLDRVLGDMGPVPVDSAVITATTKAGIDNLERIHNNRPAAGGDLVLSSLPDAVIRNLGLSAAGGINVSAACASSTIAVARAAGMITSGRADSVLVACLDLVTEFVFSGFSCIGALSPVPGMPFDLNRGGLSLGEGGAALLLMSETRAQKEGRSCLGRIAGWGAAGDSAHITAPARDGCGLIRAVSSALDMAGIQPGRVAAILAHGTGTVYNDSMELTAFEQVFDKRNMPVVSIKGAIGHTLGAAGGIEVAMGLQMLLEQTAPPTVGFTDPEGWAGGRVKTESQAISGDYLLTTNSGFGGINAALILEKGKKE